MSDEFDKEAERDKLRKKLEKEEQAREATQHMSDLLLKGATMTNQHCGECGDPIFRQDGQRFCPTCERTIEDDESTDDAAVASDADPQAESEQPPAPEAQRDAERASAETRDTTSRESARASDDFPEPSQQRPGQSGSEERVRDLQAAEAQAGNEIATARATLVRTLARFAQRAEATDDPRRARDCLEAAHEAAETIAAIDAAGR